MNDKLRVLIDVLGALGVSPSIKTVNDRLLIQKSIFLAQIIGGVPMGYSYGWYVRGPYAPSLTRDYYALQSELLAIGASSYSSLSLLRKDVRSRLQQVARLLSPPDIIPLTKSEWAELIASVVYLREVERLGDEKVMVRIEETKPWLAQYSSDAMSLVSGYCMES